MDLYNLNLKSQDEFNMNVEKDDFEHFIKNVKVFEYDLKQKEENWKNYTFQFFSLI